jgi:transcriptional regulator with XRE-family HTH domain
MRTELARRSRVSLSLIKLIELQGHQPSAPKAQLLADALGVDITEFSVLTDDAAA